MSPRPAVEEHAQVESTQENARARAKEGCAHGVVVVAVEQRAGHGRRGRAWSSGAHGLWMSMVLRVDLPWARALRLSFCVCDTIATVLGEAGAVVSVKWPNDIMIPSTTTQPRLGPFRKAGGMLIDCMEIEDQRLRTAILGIGLNLTTPAGGFPPEIAEIAGSLDDAGLLLPRLALAERLQSKLMSVADVAADDSAFAGVSARLSACSATLGRQVRVDSLEGLAVGFDVDGALRLRDAGGELHTVHAGDVMLA
ncbi:MAG: biotin--[acetyl-CoA-carboxylase] ligase [Deltaproteobacteria bacterium]|nr:biotin--[acetyl-CoA-carboxylase] ligase [Deltaproteobacteria bacterium]